MGKVSELSMLVEELHKCGEALIGISEELADMFSGAEEEKQPAKKSAPKKKASEEPKPEPQEEKPLTLEDVRAVLAEKSRNGHTAKIRELLDKHGAAKLSEIDPQKYAALLAEAEVLGNG